MDIGLLGYFIARLPVMLRWGHSRPSPLDGVAVSPFVLLLNPL